MKAKNRLSPFALRAEQALRGAVADAIERHRRSGTPIVIQRNGKMVIVPANEIPAVREDSAEYEPSFVKKESE